MKRIMTITAAAAILLCLCGCSSLIRQKKPAPQPTAGSMQQKRKAAPAKPKDLTAEQIAAITPEQLMKYHQEQQKIREQEEQASRAASTAATSRNPGKREKKGNQSLVDSFMNDRPSREKRRRMGDVSRQLDYSESNVFPWRTGRRSEKIRRR